MGIFSGLAGAYAERKVRRTGMPYKPYEPRARSYEDIINAELVGNKSGSIRGLYTSADPYGGQGLGYTAQEMEGKFGQGRDVLAGEAAGETQRTADRFRSSGGLGLQSAMYARAQQRSDIARVSRANELRRDMIVKNAEQKRADKLARLAAVTGAYQDIVGIYNYYRGAKAANIRKGLASVGEAGDSALSAAGGGMM
jgi:hypothetical protein